MMPITLNEWIVGKPIKSDSLHEIEMTEITFSGHEGKPESERASEDPGFNSTSRVEKWGMPVAQG
jgi:hypothetical protein